jgi:hypothetical protein
MALGKISQLAGALYQLKEQFLTSCNFEQIRSAGIDDDWRAVDAPTG